MVKMQMGRFKEARTLLEKAVILSDPEHDAPHLQTHALNPGIYSRSYLAHVLSFLGCSDDALALVKGNLALARRRAADASHIYTYVSALALAGRVHLLLRNANAVNEVSQELVRVSRQNHYGYFEATGRIQQGWAIAEMGSIGLGIRQMHEGLVALERTGTGLGVAGACVQLSELYVRLGKKTEAGQVLEGATGPSGRRSRIWDAEISRVRGEIALLAPDSKLPFAEESFREALDIARNQEARVLQQRAAVSYARLLQQQDRCSDAICILNAAICSSSPKLETKDFATARLLMKQLRGGSQAPAGSRSTGFVDREYGR
jgi:tetratricopeptide (TPR) repeat protein